MTISRTEECFVVRTDRKNLSTILNIDFCYRIYLYKTKMALKIFAADDIMLVLSLLYTSTRSIRICIFGIFPFVYISNYQF